MKYITINISILDIYLLSIILTVLNLFLKNNHIYIINIIIYILGLVYCNNINIDGGIRGFFIMGSIAIAIRILLFYKINLLLNILLRFGTAIILLYYWNKSVRGQPFANLPEVNNEGLRPWGLYFFAVVMNLI